MNEGEFSALLLIHLIFLLLHVALRLLRGSWPTCLEGGWGLSLINCICFLLRNYYAKAMETFKIRGSFALLVVHMIVT